MFKGFLMSKSGTTAVEYALIAGVLVLAIIAGAAELGRLVGEAYGDFGQSLATAAQ